MPKFKVYIRNVEVHSKIFEANSPEEAEEMAEDLMFKNRKKTKTGFKLDQRLLSDEVWSEEVGKEKEEEEAELQRHIDFHKKQNKVV